MWDIVLSLSFLNCWTVTIKTLRYFGTSKTNYQSKPHKFAEELDVQKCCWDNLKSDKIY